MNQLPKRIADVNTMLKRPGPLCVRNPDGGEFLRLEPTVGQPVTIPFPLPTEQFTLSDRVHLRPIRAAFRGDSVVAMECFGAPLAFFPELTN